MNFWSLFTEDIYQPQAKLWILVDKSTQAIDYEDVKQVVDDKCQKHVSSLNDLKEICINYATEHFKFIDSLKLFALTHIMTTKQTIDQVNATNANAKLGLKKITSTSKPVGIEGRIDFDLFHKADQVKEEKTNFLRFIKDRIEKIKIIANYYKYMDSEDKNYVESQNTMKSFEPQLANLINAPELLAEIFGYIPYSYLYKFNYVCRLFHKMIMRRTPLHLDFRQISIYRFKSYRPLSRSMVIGINAFFDFGKLRTLNINYFIGLITQHQSSLKKLIISGRQNYRTVSRVFKGKRDFKDLRVLKMNGYCGKQKFPKLRELRITVPLDGKIHTMSDKIKSMEMKFTVNAGYYQYTKYIDNLETSAQNMINWKNLKSLTLIGNDMSAFSCLSLLFPMLENLTLKYRIQTVTDIVGIMFSGHTTIDMRSMLKRCKYLKNVHIETMLDKRIIQSFLFEILNAIAESPSNLKQLHITEQNVFRRNMYKSLPDYKGKRLHVDIFKYEYHHDEKDNHGWNVYSVLMGECINAQKTITRKTRQRFF